MRRDDAEWMRVYMGGARSVGADFVLRQPDLARTLDTVASHGPGCLYGGELGRRMVEHLQARGGCLSMADLQAVEAQWVDPIATGYRGLRVHTLPPPAESFQFLLTLAMLEGLDVSGLTADGPEHLDTMIRAIRLAAELRIERNRCSADEVRSLLCEETLAPLRERIRRPDPISGRTEQWGGNLAWPDGAGREHTTSFSAADAEGNMVCVTQSLGSCYGSGVVVPGTGVCMNNFLNWCDLEPDSPNFLRAGAPLAMCLAPSISTDSTGAREEPVLALGTPGSYGILQTQAQVMVQHVDFGLDLQAAVEAPRLRAWDGRAVDVERRIGSSTIAALRTRGHDARAVAAYTWKVGGFHGVRRDPATGALTGAADPRRDGYAVPA